MKKHYLLLSLMGLTLPGCSMIDDSISALQRNREAIEMSTYAISENVQAVQDANRGIEENRRQLEAINKTLHEASQSS